MKKFFPALLRKIIFFSPAIILAGLLFPLNAQVPRVETNTGLKVDVDSIHHKVKVEFSAGKPVYNLLVLVTDSSGNTVFLDNQYQFKGEYRRDIDINAGKKQKYVLQIIRDDDRFTKEIIIP